MGNWPWEDGPLTATKCLERGDDLSAINHEKNPNKIGAPLDWSNSGGGGDSSSSGGGGGGGGGGGALAGEGSCCVDCGVVVGVGVQTSKRTEGGNEKKRQSQF